MSMQTPIVLGTDKSQGPTKTVYYAAKNFAGTAVTDPLKVGYLLQMSGTAPTSGEVGYEYIQPSTSIPGNPTVVVVGIPVGSPVANSTAAAGPVEVVDAADAVNVWCAGSAGSAAMLIATNNSFTASTTTTFSPGVVGYTLVANASSNPGNVLCRFTGGM